MDPIGTALSALLRPDQRAILADPARRKYVANGRRWGKTVLGGIAITRAAMLGLPCAWVAPTYRNSRPVWRQATRLASVLKRHGEDVRIRETDRTIEFPARGGWFSVYTGDNPDSMRGESFGYVVVDEAAYVKEEMIGDVLEPTLADLAGTMLCISTPSGLNWFYREWSAARSDPSTYSAAWTAPTSDNPMPTIRTAFDKARAVLPELRFRQEWLAEFLSGSGLVFRNVDDCATAPRVERAEPGRRYAMGVDLARLTDFTVISVLDCTDEVPREVYLDRFQGVDWRLQIDRIAAVVGAFKPGMIAVDQTGVGDMPVGELQVALPDTVVWGVRFNVANKTAMVHGLAAAFERFGIEIQPDPVRMSELRAYSGKERLSGTLEYGAPSGMHDDTVSALMLAYDVAQHVNAPGMITI